MQPMRNCIFFLYFPMAVYPFATIPQLQSSYTLSDLHSEQAGSSILVLKVTPFNSDLHRLSNLAGCEPLRYVMSCLKKLFPKTGVMNNFLEILLMRI